MIEFVYGQIPLNKSDISKVKHGADLLQLNHPHKQVKCLEMCWSSSGSNSNDVPITNLSVMDTRDSNSYVLQTEKLTLFLDSDSDQKESFNTQGMAMNTDVEESENGAEETQREVRENKMKLRSDVEKKCLIRRQSNRGRTCRSKSDTQTQWENRNGETFSSDIKPTLQKKRTKSSESRKLSAKRNASRTDVSSTKNNENVNVSSTKNKENVNK